MGPVEVAQVAYNAGWRGAALVEAVAYAFIESSWDPNAVSSTGCSGLWQLCPAPSGWQDPQTNAHAAYAKWKACQGGSFACDWTPYDQGPANPRWAQGFAQAQQAAQGIPGSTSSSSSGDTAGGLGAIGASIGHFGGLVTSTAKGVGNTVLSGSQALVGVLLLGVGLVVLLLHTDAGRGAVRVGKDAVRTAVAVMPK